MEGRAKKLRYCSLVIHMLQTFTAIVNRINNIQLTPQLKYKNMDIQKGLRRSSYQWMLTEIHHPHFLFVCQDDPYETPSAHSFFTLVVGINHTKKTEKS